MINNLIKKSSLRLKSQNKRKRGQLRIMRSANSEGFPINFKNFIKNMNKSFIKLQVDFKRS